MHQAHGGQKREMALYLLIKVLGREEEVVEWHEVSLQQTHQQHQIHTVCKLRQRHSQVMSEHYSTDSKTRVPKAGENMMGRVFTNSFNSNPNI